MCGIAGLITPPFSNTSYIEQGHKMLASLRHRGPDSKGIWENKKEGIILTHSRLAIQDLSEHGHQPMWSASGRYCIIFNGEIYNFKELASELIASGHQFVGHSDTEVLLSAVEEWGLERAVLRFIGMFAFAIWDAQENALILCRDRLGEKPLYYGWIDNCLYFASELKAIEAVVPKTKLEIGYQGLTHYLQYGYITSPHSIYNGIYKLVPGSILTIHTRKTFDHSRFSPHADNSILGPKTYWSVRKAANFGLKNLIETDQEAIEELEALLNKTIKMQKIADVGLGVFLSGGIDSSTVAAIAQQNSTDKIKTYSIGFNEKEYDESDYAEKVAMHLGTEHSTINVSSTDCLNIVSELSSIFDEPFSDSSQIPMYIVSKFARSKVTVCLSGDGGDELFAGYNRYLSTDHVWRKFNYAPLLLRKGLGKILEIPRPCFWDNLYKSLVSFGDVKKYRQKLIGLKMQKLAGLMQQNDIMAGYDYLLSYWNHPKDLISFKETNIDNPLNFTFPKTESFINKAMYLDQTTYLPGDNLAKVDRSSMAVSLETRLPLLSHEMVELSWRIPVSMKVRGNSSKWILRQILFKYVPRHLIERPKMGFSVPIAQWLRGDLREWADDLFALIGTNGYEFLIKKPISLAWEEHLEGKRDHSQKLWTILMLLSWAQKRAK